MENCRWLVSIGVPTYNRAHLLRRTVESVLAQDYANLELVISDNASTDETPLVCEDFCRQDSRVRYIRQPVNNGPTANYTAVFKESRGELYMNFADDDWLGPSYISECVRALMNDPELILVCGKARFFDGEMFSHEECSFDLLQDNGEERIKEFYRRVGCNGMFHGIIRHQSLAAIPPMRNIFGNDWLYMAAVAFAGKVKSLDHVVVNRSLGGTSDTAQKIAEVFVLPRLQARFPSYNAVIAAFKDIAWESPVYRSLAWGARLRLACNVALILRSKLDIWNRTYFARLIRYRFGKMADQPVMKRCYRYLRSVAALARK